MKKFISQFYLLVILTCISFSCQESSKDNVTPKAPKKETLEPESLVGNWNIKKHKTNLLFENKDEDIFGKTIKTNLVPSFTEMALPLLFSSSTNSMSTNPTENNWEGKVINIKNSKEINITEPKSKSYIPISYKLSTSEKKNLLTLNFNIQDPKSKSEVLVPIDFEIKMESKNKVILTKYILFKELVIFIQKLNGMNSRGEEKNKMEQYLVQWQEDFKYDGNLVISTIEIELEKE